MTPEHDDLSDVELALIKHINWLLGIEEPATSDSEEQSFCE